MRHLLALALLSSPLLANGTIEVRGDGKVVALTRHAVTGTLRDQLAEVTVEQVFLSHGTRQVEGVYLFALPPGASVSAFEMTVGGKTMRGEILERGKARRIYEDIVNRRQDPALLEKLDHETFRARVFPIEPGKEVSIRLTYQQLLDDHDGLLELRYPLARGRLGATDVARIELRFDIESSIDLVRVASPSHDARTETDGKRRAWLTLAGGPEAQGKDFLLRVQRDPEAIGFTLTGDAGTRTFLAILSPPTRLPEEKIPPRDVVYVVDTSGSMDGDKLKQAKAALKHGVSLLRERDRFRILPFATEVQAFRDGWTPASAEHKEAALAWIDQLDANGGTAIDDALKAALEAGDAKRLSLVVFLTDGLPTVGERDPGRIVANVKARNAAAMRIFCFGVGFDQGVPFLDELALSTRASREYVTQQQDLEAALVRFFDRVQQPALTDLRMDWGSGTTEVYPRPLPDLFAGDRLVIVGKYGDAGPRAVKLEGTRLGERVEFTYEGSLPDRGGVPAVARLWAQRKIDFLLAEISRNGMSAELRDEIVSLAKRNHIVTPYTAGLVVEDEAIETVRRGSGGGEVVMEEVADRNEVDIGSEFEETAGDDGLSDVPFAGGGKVFGVGDAGTNSAIGLGGGAGGGRRGRGGRRNLRAGGGSGLTEKVVELHLEWIDAQKSDDTGAIGGVEDTSLALLAMLGAGYTDRGSERENRYGRCVRGGLRFLLSSQRADASFADPSRPGWIRTHAVATLALAEAYWMTRNPRYRAPAQQGLDLLARARTPAGGWKAAAGGEDDTLATVWALLALQSGKFAGLQVDPDAFEGVRRLLEARKDSLSPDEQAGALLARILLGEDPRTSVAIRALADALLAHVPKWREDPPLDLWHLGTMGMFQAGGRHWKLWNDAMVEAIVKSQRPADAGDLAGTWPLGEGAPSVADQAKLAMCLEVYYRYARVFGVR